MEKASSMKILLSIKPEYVSRIFSGEKRFEFRKCIFRDSSVHEVYIYATSPVKMIVGTFGIKDIHEEAPSQIWKDTYQFAGIEEDAFFTYFQGREKAYAIEIEDVREFSSPIDPRKKIDNFVPPQSFAYFDDRVLS